MTKTLVVRSKPRLSPSRGGGGRRGLSTSGVSRVSRVFSERPVRLGGLKQLEIDTVHWIDLKRSWRGIVTFQVCESSLTPEIRFDWKQGKSSTSSEQSSPDFHNRTSPHRAGVLVLAQQFPCLSCACERLGKATTGQPSTANILR